MLTFKKNKYNQDMDSEVIELCDAMNCISGIKTKESCSGHGKSPIRIFFEVRDFVGIFFLARCVDRRYFKHRWEIKIVVGDLIGKDGYLPTTYVLESINTGKKAYREAKDLVNNIVCHLNHRNFISGYHIDLSRFNIKGKPLGNNWWEKIKCSLNLFV